MGSKDLTRRLLIIQMERAIEILEDEEIIKHSGGWWDQYEDLTELKRKLHEIRRDSIRLIKQIEGK